MLISQKCFYALFELIHGRKLLKGQIAIVGISVWESGTTMNGYVKLEYIPEKFLIEAKFKHPRITLSEFLELLLLRNTLIKKHFYWKSKNMDIKSKPSTYNRARIIIEDWLRLKLRQILNVGVIWSLAICLVILGLLQMEIQRLKFEAVGVWLSCKDRREDCGGVTYPTKK